MALKVKFFSEEHQVEFPEAYVRIVEGSFNTRRVDLLVGVYPSLATRAKEQEWEQADAVYEQCRDLMFSKENELKAIRKEFLRLTDSVAALLAKKESGEGYSEDDLRKQENSLAQAREILNKLDEEYIIACRAEVQARESLDRLIVPRPLVTKKFTFPLSTEAIEKDGLFKLLYAALKSVPEFSEAEDV